MADAGGWRWQKEVIEKQFPGARVSSTYRPGSTGSGGSPDYHSRGLAVDIHPPRMDIFNWLAANYPGAAEIIFTPAGDRQIKNGQPHRYSGGVAAGHHDHIHWAMEGKVDAAGVAGGAQGAVSQFGGLTAAISFLTDKSMWARVGVGIAALFLVLFGLARLTGGAIPDPTKLVKKAGKAVKKVAR